MAHFVSERLTGKQQQATNGKHWLRRHFGFPIPKSGLFNSRYPGLIATLPAVSFQGTVVVQRTPWQCERRQSTHPWRFGVRPRTVQVDHHGWCSLAGLTDCTLSRLSGLIEDWGYT
jgi:hypothetical protein